MIPGKINEANTIIIFYFLWVVFKGSGFWEKEKQRRIHCPKPKTRKWEEKMVEECGS